MNISYTHSFGMTQNYFVHFEQPLAVNLPRAVLLKPLRLKRGDVLVPFEGESVSNIHLLNDIAHAFIFSVWIFLSLRKILI